MLRTLRNIAIIALLALVVAVAPGGGNAAAAIMAVISLLFFVLIGLGARELYRQHRFEYLGLPDGQRTLFVGSLGAIVLMIAGAQKLTATGAGLLVWVAVLAFSVITIVKVWGDARARF